MKPLPTFTFLLQDPRRLVAFGFGLGLSPTAPGTVGTVLGLPLFLIVSAIQLPIWALVVCYMVLFSIGVHICQVTGDDVGEPDYGGIVWDEIVAFAICLHFVPTTVLGVLSAFAAFRLFDITKPWPINLIDRYYKSGLGVMLDDLAAGLYAIALLMLIQRWVSLA
jgi:phosphatidylglycerophosphatase A